MNTVKISYVLKVALSKVINADSRSAHSHTAGQTCTHITLSHFYLFLTLMLLLLPTPSQWAQEGYAQELSFMVTSKDSIYLQLNCQSPLPSALGCPPGELLSSGSPAQLTSRAASTQTQHQGRAEPRQAGNHASPEAARLPPRSAVLPTHSAPAPGTAGTPWHCWHTCASRARPGPKARSSAREPALTLWSQSGTLSKQRSLPSLPLSCTGRRNERV